jgi:hypothetical protein
MKNCAETRGLFFDGPRWPEARRGDFIADDFSISQFIGSNLAFAATLSQRTKMLHSRSRPPRLAASFLPSRTERCPLLGVKRTSMSGGPHVCF